MPRIFIELIQNISLLLALCMAYRFIYSIMRQGTLIQKIITGCMFGLFCIIGMLTPFNYGQGIIFDGRSIIISLAGFFGGLIPALITAIVASAYRLFLGGIGAKAGVGVIVASALIGVIYHYIRQKKPNIANPWHLYLFGIFVHLAMVFLMLTLPAPHNLKVFTTIFFPVMLIYPVGTVLIAGLLSHEESSLRLQKELTASEAKYRELVENANSIILRRKTDGTITFFNEYAQKFFGYSEDEIIGKNVIGTIIPETESSGRDLVDMLRGISKHPDQYTVNENENMLRNGERVWVSWTNKVLNDNTGKTIEVLAIGNNITERKRIEAELIRLATAIEQAQETVMIMNPDGVVQYINKAVEQFTKKTREEMIGKNIFENEQASDQLRQAWKTVTEGKIWTGLSTQQNLHGTVDEVEYTMSPVFNEKGNITSIISIGRDVTRERQLEQQLIQVQKMEAIGTFAGGIAHDFNNILGGILGFTQIAQDELPKESPSQYYLAETKKLGDRAAALVKQILSFSRKNLLECKPVIIHLIVKEALKLLRASLPTTIDIRQSIDEQTGLVMSDPTQIHQVIMNLCANAAHAMEGKTGVLGIDLSPVEISHEDIKIYPEVHPGDYVKLTINDTGAGIDPTIVDRIFDPFFTTKDVGKGTGMGLSIVHGIVKSHGGTITVESTPGMGSTFQVLLPRMSGDVEEETEDTTPLPCGTERILFVDDEEVLMGLAKIMLEPLGYKVTAVQSSKEALALFQKAPEKFDLVITDLTMPHMTGYDLIRQLIRFRPDIPAILCTGYNDTILENKEKEQSIKAVLIKPVNRRVLAETIRKVLDTQ